VIVEHSLVCVLVPYQYIPIFLAFHVAELVQSGIARREDTFCAMK
jgi:hypothetical protein